MNLGTTEGRITIRSYGDIATSGSSAIGINAATVYGPIDITAFGDVAVSGAASIGINAQTQGDVTITTFGDVAAGPDSSVGISGLSQSGDVLINAFGRSPRLETQRLGIYARAGGTATVAASAQSSPAATILRASPRRVIWARLSSRSSNIRTFGQRRSWHHRLRARRCRRRLDGQHHDHRRYLRRHQCRQHQRHGGRRQLGGHFRYRVRLGRHLRRGLHQIAGHEHRHRRRRSLLRRRHADIGQRHHDSDELGYDHCRSGRFRHRQYRRQQHRREFRHRHRRREVERNRRQQSVHQPRRRALQFRRRCRFDAGNVFNYGTLAPGGTGLLQPTMLDGNFTQGSAGRLAIETPRRWWLLGPSDGLRRRRACRQCRRLDAPCAC